MRKIILGLIITIGLLNAEKIIIQNEKSKFAVKGTIELDVKKDNHFIEAKIKRGTLRLDKKFDNRYISSIQLCVGEDITKRWNIEICSQEYNINKTIRKNKIFELEKHTFLLPTQGIGKELNKKWFIVRIACGEKRKGTCYMHNRSKTLDKFGLRSFPKLKKPEKKIGTTKNVSYKNGVLTTEEYVNGKLTKKIVEYKK